jgi:hypothetical protein
MMYHINPIVNQPACCKPIPRMSAEPALGSLVAGVGIDAQGNEEIAIH